MSRIELLGLAKAFGHGSKTTSVLRDVSLVIEPRELCVFIGPSGCGKSTLLRLIAGLEEPSAGHIAIDGRVVDHLPPAERNVAMVFQSYALYPHMSVHENMAFGLRYQKREAGRLDAAEIERRVAGAAQMLGLASLLQRRPRDLSGGQRQRVAIGRALVRQPGVFLLDEPLSNLDAALRLQTRLELARLHRELGSTSMVYVTHDQIEAMTLADKIVLLKPLAGPPEGGMPSEPDHRTADRASVAQIGAPLDLYHHPVDRFVAGFMGSPAMNFIEAHVNALAITGVGVTLHGSRFEAAVMAEGLTVDETVAVGIRPESVVLGRGPGRARILHLEPLGELNHVYLEVAPGAAPLLAKTRREDLHRGDSMAFDLPANAMHLFRSSGLAQRRHRDSA